ncbi:MAG: LD-carboxypeptidase [Spirochaetaceae bacterium]|nr:MAG: LD-carboxypeptidase [Spirochaetaceae bacterium]
MNELIKPAALCAGDTVATISLSGGRAGDPDMIDRYHVGKKRLQDVFGLNVVETRHCLMGSDYLYRHPRARAQDLTDALMDSTVKGIISNQGGDDAYRLLPYIDFKVIHDHPKVFIGFSDISTVHNMFTFAGVSSFYGPNLLTPIAQPSALDSFTRDALTKALFSREPIGVVDACKRWTPIEWRPVKSEEVAWTDNTGYEVIQGRGQARGRLLGGCCGPLQQIMGTCLFPTEEQWKDSIVFLEIGAPYGSALAGLHVTRAFAATGMFRHAKALICTSVTEQDKETVLKVLRDEEGLTELPILCNGDFGHRTPMTVLPIGAMAEVDCENAAFTILESGVR